MTDASQSKPSKLELELAAARETIEALKKAAEQHSKVQPPDNFAVRKAIANLQNTLAVRDRELERSEKRYRTIFDHSPLMIFIIDEAGCITDLNRTALVAFDKEREIILGSPLVGLFPADGRRVIHSLLSNEGATAQRLSMNGDRLADASIASVPGFSGRQILLQDVTQQQVIEAQLQHSQRMEAIGQLAGGVAHDINNMLCGIIGFSELLKDRLIDSKSLSYNNQVLRACESANVLVSRLLAFARRGKMQIGPVCLNEIITSVISIVERTFDRRIHVKIDLPDQDLIVEGDAAQLESVILNLALNARDAMPDGGEITFELRTINSPLRKGKNGASPVNKAPWGEIFICDTGMGIPEKFLSRIFEPFFTTKPVGKGTGLGLSAAYGTVKQHHGTLTANNRDAGGCCFRVRLPLSETQRAPKRAKKQAVVPASGLVLLVDDDTAVRTSTSKLLEGIGYEVLQADCGVAGLELFEKHQAKISVVLLDMVMPDLHGTDVLAQIRKINPNVLILAISGYSAGQNLFGANGFLRKPFTIADLSHALAALLPSNPSSSA
jgi:signal transduction histidine kinase/CheY-like chemotaxis protein